MTQAISTKPVTFDEFIDWYPERFGQARDGQRTEMEKGIYHYNG